MRLSTRHEQNAEQQESAFTVIRRFPHSTSGFENWLDSTIKYLQMAKSTIILTKAKRFGCTRGRQNYSKSPS
jgi:hypothetical protein